VVGFPLHILKLLLKIPGLLAILPGGTKRNRRNDFKLTRFPNEMIRRKMSGTILGFAIFDDV